MEGSGALAPLQEGAMKKALVTIKIQVDGESATLTLPVDLTEREAGRMTRRTVGYILDAFPKFGVCSELSYRFKQKRAKRARSPR